MAMSKVVARLIKDYGVNRERAEAKERRGLTEDDIDWNRKLNRPALWKETVDPDAEASRRAAFTRREQDLAEAATVLAIP